MPTTPATAEPQSPDSLTAQLLADDRTALIVARTGLLQAMHPQISDLLVAAPGFFDDPWPCAMPLASAASGTGLHDPPQAELGEEQSAWVHATLLNSLLVGADLLGHPLNAYEQEEVYGESLLWPVVPGGPAGGVVAGTLHDFRLAWHATLTGRLEPTEAVLCLLRPDAAVPVPSPLPVVGSLLTRLGVPGARALPLWVGRGLLPPEARETLGLDWSAAEERALQALFAALRAGRPVRRFVR